MKVQTSRFGEIEVPDESLITFPEGIIGFKEASHFVIFECGDEGLFKWLQSVDTPELAFVICESSVVVPGYQIFISKKETGILGLEDPEDAAVCLILAIGEDPMETTANLLGPIVMNSETRIGMQMVVVNPEYSTRFKVFAKSAKSGETKNAGA